MTSIQPDRMDRVLARTQSDLFWVPPTVRVIDRPDVLALADGSRSDLTNQVVRTSAGAARIPALVEEISALHTQVSQWLVVPGQDREALLEALPRFGYEAGFEGDAWTVASDSSWEGGRGVRVVLVEDAGALRHNMDVCDACFGRPLRADADVARDLALCTGPAARTARFVAYVDDAPAGSANINAHDDVAFGFLWAGATLPAYRGRGVYRALLAARCRWAAARGLSRVGLYARHDTSGPIVAALGFDRHGPMAHWRRQAPLGP